MVWTAGLSSNENLSLHMAGRMRVSAGVLVALLMLSTMPMMAQADVAISPLIQNSTLLELTLITPLVMWS